MPSNRPLAIILVAFVVLASTYSLVTPLGEAADEVSHWAYVEYLKTEQRLPHAVGAVSGESHQPPLYYAIIAIATGWISSPEFGPIANPDFRLGDPKVPNLLLHPKSESYPFTGTALAWHWGRIISVIMGAVTVLMTWKIARELLPARLWVALAGAAFVAFLPQFVFISAVINNDSLVVMLTAVGTLVTLRMASQPRSWGTAILLGVVLGLAVLAKISGLVLWIFAAAILVPTAIKSKDWARSAFEGSIVIGIAVGLCMPWFWRNWVEHGDLLGWSYMLANVPHVPPPESVGDWVRNLGELYTSFWGRFGGATQLEMDGWVYLVLGCVMTVPLIGWVLYARDGFRRKLDRNLMSLAIIVGIYWGILLLSHVRWTLTLGTVQSRQLFPGLPLLAVFLATGLHRIAGARAKLAVVVSGGLGSVLAVGVLLFIAGTYASTALPNGTVVSKAVPSAVFAETIQVLATRLEQTNVRTGEDVRVGITWRALKPTSDVLWLKLKLAANDQTIAEADGVPSGGTVTTDKWQSGQVFVSTHRVQVPQDAPPGEYTVKLGLHPFGSWKWLLVGGQDLVDLGKINVIQSLP